MKGMGEEVCSLNLFCSLLSNKSYKIIPWWDASCLPSVVVLGKPEYHSIKAPPAEPQKWITHICNECVCVCLCVCVCGRRMDEEVGSHNSNYSHLLLQHKWHPAGNFMITSICLSLFWWVRHTHTHTHTHTHNVITSRSLWQTQSISALGEYWCLTVFLEGSVVLLSPKCMQAINKTVNILTELYYCIRKGVAQPKM